jgi:hypothetical protein
MDRTELALLEEALRKAMADAAGPALDAALAELGWAEMLAGPEAAVTVPLVFRLLGETGAHASVLNDVLLTAGASGEGTVSLPSSGGSRLIWSRDTSPPGEPSLVDPELPLHRTDSAPVPLSSPALAAGRRALGWWLLGSGRAMLALARTHALDRTQFGRPIARFQAVRHRLAETLVALEGAEAALTVTQHPDQSDQELASALAKAAAGRAALTTARHCQQVLGGIGFTAEHEFHRHFKRVLVLDTLLGSTRRLTREAGTRIRETRAAPRLVEL